MGVFAAQVDFAQQPPICMMRQDERGESHEYPIGYL